jgi:hypothetical protein
VRLEGVNAALWELVGVFRVHAVINGIALTRAHDVVFRPRARKSIG